MCFVWVWVRSFNRGKAAGAKFGIIETKRHNSRHVICAQLHFERKIIVRADYLRLLCRLSSMMSTFTAVSVTRNLQLSTRCLWWIHPPQNECLSTRLPLVASGSLPYLSTRLVAAQTAATPHVMFVGASIILSICEHSEDWSFYISVCAHAEYVPEPPKPASPYPHDQIKHFFLLMSLPLLLFSPFLRGLSSLWSVITLTMLVFTPFIDLLVPLYRIHASEP